MNDDAGIWTELIIMPNSPRRDPQALVDVFHTAHEVRSSRVHQEDVDKLRSRIDTAYAKLASCEQATVDHCCVTSIRTDGTYDDGALWSRITLVYDRRCVMKPTGLQDFMHNTANWLNQAGARLRVHA
jgi:hypothetical protein